MPPMKALGIALTACLAASPVWADFSYQQRSQITGGAMASMMKFAGAFSKQAREPMVFQIYVSGHKIARIGAHTGEIIDVDKETITHISFDRKTYSVTTFEQMKQQMQKMAEQAKNKSDANSADVQFKVSANATGQTKDIDGLNAKEMVMTLSMEGTDAKTGQSGSLDLKSDMWMAPVAGYEEVRELYQAMGQKLGFVPGMGFGAMERPDLVKGMGELANQMAKMEGTPVETVTTIAGSGRPSNSDNNSSLANSDSSDNPLARVRGLGGFGGFGRKKKNTEQQDDAAASPAHSSNGVLAEITSQSSNFSSAPLDPSKFELPAGFRQVESK
jgi:hypothetical protein